MPSYIYVPFGPFIMGYIQDTMAKHSGGAVQLANTPEKAGLGPRTSVQKQHEIKSGRLKNQLFACTCAQNLEV
jgi:anoctamin-10